MLLKCSESSYECKLDDSEEIPAWQEDDFELDVYNKFTNRLLEIFNLSLRQCTLVALHLLTQI